MKIIFYLLYTLCLKCFDAVGWAAERASSLLKIWGWWRWALVSPDGVAPSRMVGVSASVGLPLHHQVQKLSSGTGSPRWSRKKGRKTVAVVVWYIPFLKFDDQLYVTKHSLWVIQNFHIYMLWQVGRATAINIKTVMVTDV